MFGLEGRVAVTSGGVQEPVRSTKRRAETRRKLVAAAYEVFAERGIRDTPVEAICERAGFTRGAFYSNFATKEDLFLALWQEQLQTRIDRLQAIVEDTLARRGGDSVADAASVRESLAEMARAFMEPLTGDADWYMLATEFRAHVLRLPDLRGRVLAAEEELNQGLARALGTMLDGFGMTLSVPEDDMVLVIVAVYEMAIQRAVLAGGTLAPDDQYVTELLPTMLDALIIPATEGESG